MSRATCVLTAIVAILLVQSVWAGDPETKTLTIHAQSCSPSGWFVNIDANLKDLPKHPGRIGQVSGVFRSFDDLFDVVKIPKEERTADLRKAANQCACQALNVKDIDWKKHMLICYAPGRCIGDGSNFLDVKRITSDGKTIVVEIDSYPCRDQSAKGIYEPATLALVDRCDGTAEFQVTSMKLPYFKR